MNISLSIIPPPPAFTPVPLSSNLTEEQMACVQWTNNPRGHLIIEAVAGSGKTFTIIQMIANIINWSGVETLQQLQNGAGLSNGLGATDRWRT